MDELCDTQTYAGIFQLRTFTEKKLILHVAAFRPASRVVIITDLTIDVPIFRYSIAC